MDSPPDFSIAGQLSSISQGGIDVNSRQAFDQFDLKACTPPTVESQVELFELIANTGLKEDSRLFLTLFQKFSPGLRLRKK